MRSNDDCHSGRKPGSLARPELMLLPLRRMVPLTVTTILIALVVVANVGILPAARRQEGVQQQIAARRAESQTIAPKNIVELQPFRETSSGRIRSAEGDGTAILINLNPTVNAWYLLKVVWQSGSEKSYHLENPEPRSRRLTLDSNYVFGIEILEKTAR